MSMRLAKGCGLMVAILLAASSARAGLYSTIDSDLETRYSQDFGEFRKVLTELRLIPGDNRPDKPLDNEPAIRRRYVLIEALGQKAEAQGRKGVVDLPTLEQQLNYSVVLIRRGKPDEAVQFLDPVKETHRKNIVVTSHYATACFLASSPDFRKRAEGFMKRTLDNWPQRWDQLKEEDEKFLASIKWEETAFDRNRRYEEYFQRLVKHRMKEAVLKQQKKTVPIMLDPIFVDDKGEPVIFLTTEGKFEVGRIAAAEHKKLPKDAVEVVEQLLIWMPHDDRLLWLLGEVFNASAMDHEQPKEKDRAIKNAYDVFDQLDRDAFTAGIYARKEVKERYEALKAVAEKMKTGRVIEAIPTDQQQWTRTLVVGFITGFAVGMFALWQFQEMRRRRQARLAGTR